MKVSVKIIKRYMFYITKPNHQLVNFQNTYQKTLDIKKHLLQSQVSYMHNLCANHNNKVFVFLQTSNIRYIIPTPLVIRFSRISGITPILSKVVLHKTVYSLVNNYSFNTLYFFLKKLF